MTLKEKQVIFTYLVSGLIAEAFRQEFDVTLGEAYRSPEEAERLYKLGKGALRSLHTSRLAIDLNLFRAGVYLTKSEDYRTLGEWWKRQHPFARWGGDFAKPDGNHFSLAHGGRA